MYSLRSRWFSLVLICVIFLTVLAQAQQPSMMSGMSGMSNMPAAAPVPIPQAMGPKAPGKIRIGVAPSQAQVGQGNNAGDYGTPIRNSIILTMNGPAVEIAALDSRLPMQLVAEAQQKQ